ncbi:MAG TPA: hypothetical protein VG986_17795, partial [Pseudolabrys sp.]|nr:hypothetical protein [Pseudolabrys sp.]
GLLTGVAAVESDKFIPASSADDVSGPRGDTARTRRPYQAPLLTSADWPNSTNVAKPITSIEYTTTSSPYHAS